MPLNPFALTHFTFSVLGLHVAISVAAPPQNLQGAVPGPIGPPYLAFQSHQSPQRTKHLIRIIDEASGSPIQDARVTVTVELKSVSETRTIAHEVGCTNASGVFAFSCPRYGSAQMHTSVEATGFWAVDDDSPLVRQHEISLLERNEHTETGIEKSVVARTEPAGVLLTFPMVGRGVGH
jgi:hypothetical protein